MEKVAHYKKQINNVFVNTVDALRSVPIYEGEGIVMLGQHMSLSVKAYRGRSELALSEGTMINPGQRLGQLDFSWNIPILKPSASLNGFAGKMLENARASLRNLAELCINNDPRLEGVSVFGGATHLAGNITDLLGFETAPINNPIIRKFYEKQGKFIVKGIASKNTEWQKFKNKPRNAKYAFMTREKLIEKYS